MTIPFEPLLTPEQVADILGGDGDDKITPATVMRLAREGKLRGKKVGRYWRFKRSWIERWIEEGGNDGNAEISAGPTLAAQRRAQ